jgi:hypothetical protein
LCARKEYGDQNFEKFYSMWDEILLSEGDNRPVLIPKNTTEKQKFNNLIGEDFDPSL